MPRELDHAGVVAGERQHRPGLRHPPQNVGEGLRQPHHRSAGPPGLEQSRLGHAEGLGGVAHPKRAAALLQRRRAREQIVGLDGIRHRVLPWQIDGEHR